jgi:hypothetical protein
MHRDTFIAKLTEIQQNVDFLLSQLQASEHDKFAAHLYRSRREYRSACDRSGKGGKQIERCLISTFQGCRKHGLQRRLSPMGTSAADWRLNGAQLGSRNFFSSSLLLAAQMPV